MPRGCGPVRPRPDDVDPEAGLAMAGGMAVLPCGVAFGWFVKAPGRLPQGRFRRALNVRGVAPRDVQGVVCRTRHRPPGRPSRGFSPRADTTQRARSRPEADSDLLYARVLIVARTLSTFPPEA